MFGHYIDSGKHVFFLCIFKKVRTLRWSCELVSVQETDGGDLFQVSRCRSVEKVE